MSDGWRSTRRAGRYGAASVLAAAILTGTSTAVTATPAVADPGFCGVRESDPTAVGSGVPDGPNGYVVYAVRNKCASAHQFTVLVFGRSTGCLPFDPGQVRSFSSVAYDPNWKVATCQA